MGLKNLPLASGEQHAAAFARCGWIRGEKTKGKNPHIIMSKPGHRNHLSIPDHKEVKRTVIQTLLRAAKLSEDEYLNCFHKKRRK